MDKQVHEGCGALFRICGRVCAQVPEAVKAGRHVVMLGGLGIILGLFGFLWGWKARRAFTRRRPAA